jgi:MtfA peptidase
VSISESIAKALTFPWIILEKYRTRRRRGLYSGPFPAGWIDILQKNVPIYRLLNADLRKQLHGHIQVFLKEKRFEGCADLEITEEMKLTIAAQACILLFNRKVDYYPRLSTVLVYPSAYVARRIRRMGYAEFVSQEARLGESWHRDYVVLSWDDVQHAALDLKDGHNIVLHEFAHQLDQENDMADGLPLLDQRSQYVTWARVLSKEYADFCDRVYQGKMTVLDPYGAENPAEFFAVLTEAFFDKPKELKRTHPELYEEVSKLYKVDPASWGQ